MMLFFSCPKIEFIFLRPMGIYTCSVVKNIFYEAFVIIFYSFKSLVIGIRISIFTPN